MKTVSKTLSENRNVSKKLQGPNTNRTGGKPASIKETPFQDRVDRDKLEKVYYNVPVMWNAINKTTQTIMSRERNIKGPNAEFFKDWLDNVGSVGGNLHWEEVLEQIIRYQMIYGPHFIELVEDRNTGDIVDLAPIDPKSVEYAKSDRMGNSIATDDFGNPIGYVQKLPHHTGNIEQVFDVPDSVSVRPNGVFIPAENVVQFKMFTIGEGFFPIGLIEPAFHDAERAHRLKEDYGDKAHSTLFPTRVASVGDETHEPNPQQVSQFLEDLRNAESKTEFAHPYYHSIDILEPDQPDVLIDFFKHFNEELVTASGTPDAFATGSGGDVNRACYTEDTEVLTENGWKHYWEVSPGEKIAAYDNEKGELKFEVPEGLYVYDVEEEIYSVEGSRTKATVTEDHRMLTKEYRANDYQIEEIQDIDWDRARFKTAPEDFEAESDKEKIVIEGVDSSVNKYEENLEAEAEVFLEFLGYFLSEGGLSMQSENGDEDNMRYPVTFAQKDEKKTEKIRQNLESLGLNNVTEYEGENGLTRFAIADKRLWKYLRENCGAYCDEKQVPREFMNLPKEKLKVLYDALMLGDGYLNDSGTSGYYGTVSEQLADDVQEIAFKLGKSAQVNEREVDRGNRKNIYRVQICDRQDNVVGTDDGIEKYYYEGKVFCYSVSTGLMVTRKDGKVAIQGNTLQAQDKMFQISMKDLVNRTTRTIEKEIFRPIADQEGFDETPEIEWDMSLKLTKKKLSDEEVQVLRESILNAKGEE